MTRTWVIDDGPMSALLRVLGESRISTLPLETFRLAEATADSLDALTTFRDWRDWTQNRIPILRLFEGTPEFTTYAFLRGRREDDGDRAEHEAISWMRHNQLAHDAVFVAQDKGALWLALRELGVGRAAHPVDLWLHLYAEGHVTQDEFADLCHRVDAKSQDMRPPERVRGLLPL